MKLTERLRLLILILLDAAMVAMEWPVLHNAWRDSGVWMLRFYTQSSNVLALFVCTVCALAGIVCLIRGRTLPGWIKVIRYVSSCCLMVTFIVAAFVLVPMERQNTFQNFILEGDLLYLHTVCPLLMLATLFLHGRPRLGWLHTLAPLVPTLIYGVITLTMNVRHVYYGPYPFLRIHQQTTAETIFWCTAIPLGNWVLAAAMRMLSNLTCRK